jgi:hypothetical protein
MARGRSPKAELGHNVLNHKKKELRPLGAKREDV